MERGRLAVVVVVDGFGGSRPVVIADENRKPTRNCGTREQTAAVTDRRHRTDDRERDSFRARVTRRNGPRRPEEIARAVPGAVHNSSPIRVRAPKHRNGSPPPSPPSPGRQTNRLTEKKHTCARTDVRVAAPVLNVVKRYAGERNCRDDPGRLLFAEPRACCRIRAHLLGVR